MYGGSAIHIVVQGTNFLSILFKVKTYKSPLLSLVIRDASYVFAANFGTS